MTGITGGGADTARVATSSSTSAYRGAQGLDPEFVKAIERQFGFDKPAHERYFLMMKNYVAFDLGESFYRTIDVGDLILEKMPVSISLGLWSTLIIYLVSIPLGIAKAVRDGTRFDIGTSYVIVVGYAVPSFMFAILLIVLFAGGSYFNWFPLRGLTSDNWDQLSFGGKILDYFWHLTLPVLAMVIGGFASLTMLTKNSFLEEINKQYVLTAKAKGLTQRRVLYGHVFRNAMLIVIAAFPATLVGMLFTGSLLIEVIFSLDGLGLLGYQAILDRDYPVIFGTLYIFSIIGLLLNLISDLAYHAVDPRIDFEARAT
jgi:microcin C transport system permease protein